MLTWKKRTAPARMKRDKIIMISKEDWPLLKPMVLAREVLAKKAQRRAPPFKSPVTCAYPRGKAN
jgi:hypothetical protein